MPAWLHVLTPGAEIWAATKADTLSPKSRQIGMPFGLATAYPMNWVLIRTGIKKNVWPAPSASDFLRSDLVSLRQRIRSQGTALAKMEIRTSWSS